MSHFFSQKKKPAAVSPAESNVGTPPPPNYEIVEEDPEEEMEDEVNYSKITIVFNGDVEVYDKAENFEVDGDDCLLFDNGDKHYCFGPEVQVYKIETKREEE